MTLRWPSLRDLGVGDLLIGLGLLAIVGALIYPGARARAFRAVVDGAVADVETVRTAARRTHEVTGSWPPPASPGEMPTQLAGAFPGTSDLSRDDYVLQWRRWDVVEKVEGPPLVMGPDDADAPPDSVIATTISVARPIGGLVMHSNNSALLAELLARYGTGESFVRDTTWTLIVEEGGG